MSTRKLHPDLTPAQQAFLVDLLGATTGVLSTALQEALIDYVERVRTPPASLSPALFEDESHDFRVGLRQTAEGLLAAPWDLTGVRLMTLGTMTRLARTFDPEFEPFSPERIRAAFRMSARATQNTALVRRGFVPDAHAALCKESGDSQPFKANRPPVSEVFESLVERGEFVAASDNAHYQHRAFDFAEKAIATYALEYARTTYEVDVAKLDEALPSLLDASQREGARLALRHKLFLLCGGPGTGKTTLVKAIISAHGALDDAPVFLVAPTHAAKMRLAEVTGCPATTVHALVANRKAPEMLEDALVVADESSMMDTSLLAKLMRAAKRARHFILVGDDAQLPPIGAGEPFKELVAARDEAGLPAAFLTTVHRQAADNPIIQLAARVRAGDPSTTCLEDLFRFFHSANAAREAMMEVYRPHKAQVLCFNRVGTKTLGTTQVNAQCYAMQHGLQVPPFGKPHFRKGDPVVVFKNSQRFFNGQRGRVLSTNVGDDAHRNKRMRVRWDSEKDADDVPDESEEMAKNDGSDDKDPRVIAQSMCDLAHGITVHKAQGSEYDTVYVLIGEEQTVMLQRELVYTALTRAKHKLVIFCERSAWFRAVSTPAPPRRTLFMEHLRKALSGG